MIGPRTLAGQTAKQVPIQRSDRWPARPTQANLGSATQLMKGWKGGRMEVFRIGSISLDGDPYGAVREKY
jgi:hypothetical protein